jgi:hypothetical protein
MTVNSRVTSDWCGWQLSVLGAPCVAQRVCANDVCERYVFLRSALDSAIRPRSAATLPTSLNSLQGCEGTGT